MTPARLYQLLSWGRDRAVTIGALAELAGTSRRAVELAKDALIDDGAPVASGPEGIWLSESAGELESVIESGRRRLVSQYLRLRRLRRTADGLRLQRRKAAMRRDYAYLHDLGCDGQDCACRTVYRVEVVE